MKVELSSEKVHSDFVKKVEELSGQNILSCYQCGKCSAGCPSSFAMDLLPSQIIRMVQLGLQDEIMNSKTIWLCASCLTCSVRCPRGIDIAGIFEALRLLVTRRLPPCPNAICRYSLIERNAGNPRVNRGKGRR